MAVTFTKTATLATSAVDTTFVASGTVDVGTIAGDRTIWIAVGGEPGTPATPTSVTLGGIAATAASSYSQQGSCTTRLFYIPFPTATSSSTTATLAVTWTGVVAAASNTVSVYKATGASTTPVTAGNFASTDMDATNPLVTASLGVTSGNLLFVIRAQRIRHSFSVGNQCFYCQHQQRRCWNVPLRRSYPRYYRGGHYYHPEHQ